MSSINSSAKKLFHNLQPCVSTILVRPFSISQMFDVFTDERAQHFNTKQENISNQIHELFTDMRPKLSGLKI